MRRTVVLLIVSLFLVQTVTAVMAQGGQAERPEVMGSRAVTIPPPVVQGAIKNIMNGVSTYYLWDYNSKLQGFGSRFYNSQGNVNAVQWLNDTGTGMGRLNVAYHNWTVYSTMLGRLVTATDVIYTLPGLNASSNRIYYLCAHMDSAQYEDYGIVRQKAPGADDDASGTAAAIEAARLLSRYDFQDTIKFAFFNGEEIGLYGSTYYLQNVSHVWHENVQGVLDYDMVATPRPSAAYDFTVESNHASAWERTYLEGVNSRYKIGLTIADVENTGSIPTDVSSFYGEGYQGVAGHEYDWFNNNYIHTLSDTMAHVNITLEKKSTQLAVAALAEEARLIYVDVAIAPGNLTLSDMKPTEGEDVTVTANITNTGNVNATDMEVTFSDNGFPFGGKRIWVPAGGKNTTTAIWKPTIGNHNISVVLDPKNEIFETDETNNSAFIATGVNDRPRAILAVTPVTVLTNETVTLNGSLSSDAVGGIADYNFSYGDGKSTGWVLTPFVTHSYAKDGTFTTSLTVRDGNGAESLKATMPVKVLDRPPIASPYSNVTRALTLVPIKFFSYASDPDGTVTVQWALGDGNATNAMDPEHAYAKAGAYTAKLTVLDDDKNTASYELRVIIDNRAPSVSIMADPSKGDIKTDFSFKANATDRDGSIAAYQWDLGDGWTASDMTATHRYAKPGTYTVRLAVRDDDGSEARTMVNVTIIDEPPKALASANAATSMTAKMVGFRGDESSDLEGPVTYMWTFGDGNYSTEANPQHAYLRPGTYDVKLVVRDSAGQTDKATVQPIKVLNRLPKADFRTFGNYTLNGTVYFDALNSSDPEGPVTFSWEFGDGSIGTGPVPGHIYPRIGTFTVNLTVTDTEGAKARTSASVTIKAPPPPPQPPKVTKPKDLSGTVNTLTLLLIILLVVVVVLIILLAIISRRKKKAEPSYPGPPPPLIIDQAQAPTTEAPPQREGAKYPETNEALPGAPEAQPKVEAPPPGPLEKP
jgi:PKD repeat protein